MSLKTIKELVDAVDGLPSEFRLGYKAYAARSGIAALEKAAKVLGLHKPLEEDGWDEARALMEAIAKEAA